ncbi:hypothetical protein JMJ77_0008632 [Colletotrichum scovillei]|uniref:Uncharacterized protein n=1 Tax=Colletotrichum scovillei TaxID=1209932 RepID=A0A9P7UGL5_9PEZI|nr:hypothetical protein JMJ77_0008632 [Colletotrichum scovillei]KAG7075623.1 hypothetical protein JMJ76_0012081 [Colletotrichum scovillei]KAG7082737.1 hypothetical protein JMJ78_0004836 [Colletotrichum scovillei]
MIGLCSELSWERVVVVWPRYQHSSHTLRHNHISGFPRAVANALGSLTKTTKSCNGNLLNHYLSRALGKRRYTTGAPDYLCDLVMRFQPMHSLSTNQSFGYWFVDRRHQVQKTCLNCPLLTAGSEREAGWDFVLLAVE